MAKRDRDDIALGVTEQLRHARSAVDRVGMDAMRARAERVLFSSAEPAHTGRFVLLDTVATGGMGVVYRAYDPELDRKVALKVIKPRAGCDRQARERLLAEARALAQLKHPNVVPVHDVTIIDDQVVMVMELIEGATVADWMIARPRTWREIVAVYLAAGRGLAAAHALGLVHRDFKPSNVIVGDDGRVRVLDFGLARAVAADDDADDDGPVAGAGKQPSAVERTGRPEAGLTATGDLVGTPAYMAPEQFDDAAVDARADQFSFCVALSEGIHGKRPFEVAADAVTAVPLGDGQHADLGGLRNAIRDGLINEGDGAGRVPRWLRTIVKRGLRDAPSARWPSMDALLAEIERCLHRSRRSVVTMIGVLLVAGLAVWTVTHGLPPQATIPAAPAAAMASPTWIERQLTTRGDIQDQSDSTVLSETVLSPDGTAVAVLGRAALSIVPLDGRPVRLLRRGVPPGAGQLEWSPDGGHLVLRLDEPRSVALAPVRYGLINATSGETAEFEGPRNSHLVAGDEIVFPDSTGRNLAFRRLQGARRERTCVLPRDVSYVQGIVVFGDLLYVTVAVHDGRRTGGIPPEDLLELLVTDRTCSSVRVAIARMRIASFTPVRGGGAVAAVLRDGRSMLIEYGRDGRQVGEPHELPVGASAFVGRSKDGGTVFTKKVTSWRLVDPAHMDADVAGGTNPLTIVLAPDRQRVAVIERSPGEPNRLRTGRLESLDDLAPPIATMIDRVAWSPDGQMLATCDAGTTEVTIATMDPAGGDIRKLDIADASDFCDLAWLDNRRLAYPRQDKQTIVWFDIETHERGELVDPSAGMVFYPAANAAGELAVWWVREPDGGTWIVPPTAPSFRIAANFITGRPYRHRWSADGASLWIFAVHGRDIHRYDLRTRQLDELHPIVLGPDTVIRDILPLHDRVLFQIARTTTNLFIETLVPAHAASVPH